MQIQTTTQAAQNIIFISPSLVSEVNQLISDLIAYMLNEGLDYAYFEDEDFLIEIQDSGSALVGMFNGVLYFNRQSLVNAIIRFAIATESA